MKKNWKILTLFAVVVLILGGIGGSYYIKEVVKKEEVLSALEASLKKSLPGTIIQIGDLKIDYGTSVLITIDKFQVDQKFPVLNYDFLKVSRIRVKVPILSIFLGGGNIDILLDAPELYLQEKKGDKNWINAFNAKSQIEKNSPAEGQAQIVLPAFLLNSTATVRMQNSMLNYHLGKVTGELNFGKLVLKNFGLNSVAAFEVQSQYSRKNVETLKEVYSFDFTLIGSVDFADYLKTHDLKMRSNFKVVNLSVTEKTFPLNLLRGDIDLSLNKEGKILGKIVSSSSENELSTHFRVDKGKIYLSDITANLYPKDFLPFLEKNPPLNLNNSKLKITGLLDIVGGKVNPNLTFALAPFSFELFGLKPNSKAVMKVFKDELAIKLEADELQGKLTSEVSAKFDINSSKPLEERVSFFTHDLKIEGVSLTEKLLWNWLKEMKEGGQMDSLILPKGVNTFTFSKVRLGTSVYEGGGTLKIDRNNAELANFSFLSPTASVKATGEMVRHQNKSIIDLDLILTGIPTTPFFENIGDSGKKISGIAKGKIKGKWILSKENDFKTNFNLEINGGELVGFKTKELLKKAKGSLRSSLGGMKHLAYQSEELSKFQLLEANFELNNSDLVLNEFKIIPSENFFLSLKGRLDLEGEEETTVSLTLADDQYLENFLKKKTRLKAVPLSMKAIGWEFENDMVKTLGGLVRKMRFKKDRRALSRKLKLVAKNSKKKKRKNRKKKGKKK
ncbi:MAG: hypothetical protein NXH75_06870 [Halobacteriovoraceae bacterium]|nr:hypothetical protein [Halobacteriovoraceae bacterium]